MTSFSFVNKQHLIPPKITLIYAVLAGAWLLFSDNMLALFVGNEMQFVKYQMLKDVLYVIVTSAMLYFLIKATVQQIHEREKAVAESEHKYRTIFENTGSATIIVDEDMSIVLANSELEKISGFKREEIENRRDISDLFTEESFEQIKRYHYDRRKDPESAPRNYETRIRNRSGELKTVYMTVAMIPGTKQSVASILDISEAKHAQQTAKLQEQQLIQADKMATLGILVSGVAHEINNPNNFIMLNSKIIQKTWEDVRPILKEYYESNGDFVLAGMPYTRAHDKIEQLIHGISDGSQRIQQIVQSLKDYARQDSGDMQQTVKINTVIESAIIIMHNLIKKSTDRFSINYGEKIPELKGNPQRLEQVIINLISNACQALPDKEKGLHVATRFEKESVFVEVKDEGVGISKENMKHIMDPFFTTKRNSGGTGLGLSISYNIVKDHGGTLNVQSEKGRGTVVTVALPVNSGN